MYQISIADEGALKSFLSINDVDFIDVFFEEQCIRLVTSSTELYAQLILRAERSRDENDWQCRIHKKTLASLKDGDVLKVSKNDERVTTEFYNEYGSLEYTCSFSLQVVADWVYQEKSAATVSPRGLEFNLDELVTVGKIAKLSGVGVVCVDSDVACVRLKSGARVYRRVGSSLSFSLTTRSLDALRKCNHTILSVKDWLIAQNGSFTVIANKARLDSNEEFGYIAKCGAKFVAKVGLGKLFLFMNRLKVKTDSITISIANGVCCIADTWHEYRVPIKLESAQLAPGAECNEYSIPQSLLTGVLSPIGSNEFDLRITKNFNQMSCGEYVIVW